MSGLMANNWVLFAGSLFSSSLRAEPKHLFFFFFFNVVVCFGLQLPAVSVSVRPVCLKSTLSKYQRPG